MLLSTPLQVHVPVIDAFVGARGDEIVVLSAVACRDGDGTVPLPSLQVCDGWQTGGAGMAPLPSAGNSSSTASSSTYSNSRQPATHVRRYAGLRHGDIIHSAAAFADVLDALLKLGAAGRRST